jgi:hypothetical protein
MEGQMARDPRSESLNANFLPEYETSGSRLISKIDGPATLITLKEVSIVF